MSRSLARSIAAQWLGTALNVAITLLLTPLIVQSLGAENYGIFVLLVSLTGHIAVLDFGMRYALVKYVAEFKATGRYQDISSLLSSSLVALSLPSLAVILVAVWGGDSFFEVFGISADREKKIGLLLLLFVFDGVLELFSGALGSALGGCERYDLLHVSNSVRLLLYALLAVIAISLGGGILSISLALVGTKIMYRFVLACFLFRNLPQCSVRLTHVRLSSIRSIAGYGGWAFLIVLAERIINQSQPWIIGSLFNKGSIAIFALGAMLIEQVRQLGLQASTVLSTRLSTCLALNDTRMREALMKRWFLYTPVIAGFFAVPFMFSGRDFISLWIGPHFVPEADFLWLMSLTLAFVLPAFGFSAFLFACGKHWLVALVQFGEGCVSVAIALRFIESIGLQAVAIGYVVSGILGTGVILPLLAAPIVGIPVWSYLRLASKAIGAAILPYAGLLIFLRSLFTMNDWGIFFLVHGASALVCFAMTYCFVMQPDDRSYLKRRIHL